MGNENQEFDQEHFDLCMFCNVKIRQLMDATMVATENNL
jgi:hypothetical protein